MKLFRHGFACVFFGAAVVVAQAQVGNRPQQPLSPIPSIPLPPGIEIEFSGDGVDIVGRVADLITKANQEVLVSQYAITDLRVIQALCSVFQRGKIVAVILDRNPAIRNYETPAYLRTQGIPVIAAQRGLAGDGWHNQRYIVIDREVVLIMSCDLTNATRRNTDNLVVMRMPSISARYFNSWLSEATAGTKFQ